MSKKPPTVKMQLDKAYSSCPPLLRGGMFCKRQNRGEFKQSPCFARHFDLLRNSPSTVSIYADECELLVLPALVTSASLSKNKFLPD